MEEHYKILGIAPTASVEEAKKAYYRLAKQYHPQVNQKDPSAAEKFQRYSEAYKAICEDQSQPTPKNLEFLTLEEFMEAFFPRDTPTTEEIAKAFFPSLFGQSKR